MFVVSSPNSPFLGLYDLPTLVWLRRPVLVRHSLTRISCDALAAGVNNMRI